MKKEENINKEEQAVIDLETADTLPGGEEADVDGEDEKPFSSTLALKTILGGDILNTQAIRRQVWLILLITFFAILYVSNRYSCQKQQIKIDKLNKELKKAKYKTLSLSSVLTERCRESHVVELMSATNDSTIHPADQPPYIIMTPSDRQQ